MSGGSKITDDLREHYMPLAEGTDWHVFPSIYDPRAFNPKSRNRFACCAARARDVLPAGFGPASGEPVRDLPQSQPLLRAIRAASKRLEACNLEMASER